ncbi:molybdate ABC transporter substrate-binding protein [Bartonella sp. HY406]|uniref:molybdate ABC transporter substrate-binding protein n=1 Tax=Bartonella sp. HY406 TaxID=2979331 RepID=UPI0021C9E3A2|nr:molybdate ABC transporter substrate-binding protein [Bartonella sp. HY406]UXN04005.1 molybdate ABC transporter substrate-binding protein [Bartonella sp. HY406]
MRKLLTSIIAMTTIIGFGSAALADNAIIASAGGFRKPITELATQFEQQSGLKLDQVYGHMGQIITQASENKDVALACGDESVLKAAKNVEFSKMLPLGDGKLVLAFRKGLKIEDTKDIVAADITKIGVADQKSAIYGMAAREFLQNSKLDKEVDDKILPVASVPQVTSYIVSGDVDAGFINATDALGAGDKIGGFIEVDQKLYTPIKISCAVTKDHAETKVVKEFSSFLETQAAQSILKRYGL